MCFYAEDTIKLVYSLSFTMMMFPDNQQGSKATAGRKCVGFLDLDIFKDQDLNSNKWPKWVLNNHDAFFDKGKINCCPSLQGSIIKSSKQSDLLF